MERARDVVDRCEKLREQVQWDERTFENFDYMFSYAVFSFIMSFFARDCCQRVNYFLVIFSARLKCIWIWHHACTNHWRTSRSQGDTHIDTCVCTHMHKFQLSLIKEQMLTGAALETSCSSQSTVQQLGREPVSSANSGSWLEKHPCGCLLSFASDVMKHWPY